MSGEPEQRPAVRAGGRITRLTRAVDSMQQDHAWLAIGVATWKKFSDDRAGNLAALVSYYSFASVFPLLLVAYSILDLLAKGNAKLAGRLTKALMDYPIVGRIGISSGLGKTGVALLIGILLTLYSARGVANAIQNAMNSVWAVPQYQRPRFPKSLLRTLGIIAVLGPGEIITIALSTVAGGVGNLGGAGGKTVAVAVSLLLNIGLFWLGFRIATAAEVKGRDLRLGAILAAIGWQVLQLAGGLLIAHAHSRSAYGIFGVVLGLLASFYLVAQFTLYAVELDVVRARRLWPRSLAPPPLTSADVRAYQSHAEAGRLRPEIEITTTEIPPPESAEKAAAPEHSEAERAEPSPDGPEHPEAERTEPGPDTPERTEAGRAEPGPDAPAHPGPDGTQTGPDTPERTEAERTEPGREPGADGGESPPRKPDHGA